MRKTPVRSLRVRGEEPVRASNLPTCSIRTHGIRGCLVGGFFFLSPRPRKGCPAADVIDNVRHRQRKDDTKRGKNLFGTCHSQMNSMILSASLTLSDSSS